MVLTLSVIKNSTFSCSLTTNITSHHNKQIKIIWTNSRRLTYLLFSFIRWWENILFKLRSERVKSNNFTVAVASHQLGCWNHLVQSSTVSTNHNLPILNAFTEPVTDLQWKKKQQPHTQMWPTKSKSSKITMGETALAQSTWGPEREKGFLYFGWDEDTIASSHIILNCPQNVGPEGTCSYSLQRIRLGCNDDDCHVFTWWVHVTSLHQGKRYQTLEIQLALFQDFF